MNPDLTAESTNVQDDLFCLAFELETLSGIVTSAMKVHRNTDGGPILSGGTLPTGP